MFLSTSMTNRFLRSGYAAKYSLPSLKVIACAGATLKEKTQEELRRVLPRVEILQGYGKQLSDKIIYRTYNDRNSV